MSSSALRDRLLLAKMVAGIAGVWFLGASLASAQLPTATILGTVKDSSGAVVPGATLTVVNVETGQSRTGVSGGDGSYRFSALPVGNYQMRAEHPGFRSEVRSGLTLTVSQEAVVNFTLDVGGVEQTVAVTAEAPLVNTTSGSLGGLVDDRKVAELPLNGRNYSDLALLQPGVTQHKNVDMDGTVYSSNGAPIRSNSYLLDGASVGAMRAQSSAASTGTTLGVEGIREFRVMTNSFSAEYGITMGSQMTIVSKSGTNTFHGSLFEYLRNSALDARNFFDYKTAVAPRRLPAFTRNNFGGSFGGPIQRDKTFFFGVYEGLRERLGRTLVSNTIPPSAKVDGGVVPQIAPVVKPFLALFPEPNLPNNQYTFPFSQPLSQNYGQMRVDQNISASDTLFVRHTVDSGERTLPNTFAEFTESDLSHAQFATLSESHVFSPTVLNTARFSYSRTNHQNIRHAEITDPRFALVPGEMFGDFRIGGVSRWGPPSTGPSFYIQNIFTWSDDVFYTRERHSLKFGVLVNHYQQTFESKGQSRGSISFANLPAFLLAQPSTYVVLTPGSIAYRRYEYSTFGFYVQDDLRVKSNLTLNLGLRYEFTNQIEEVNGRGAALRDVQHDAETTLGPPFKNPSLKNFSPRFGFAWDVAGNGKTAVRGGFGLLYDVGVFAQALTNASTGTPPFSSRSSLQSTPGNAIVFTAPMVVPPEAAGKELRIPDYLMQQPHMLHYNLAVERELLWNTAMTLAYGGSRGINLMQFKEGNPTVPQVQSDGRQFWAGNEPRTNPYWGNMGSFATAGGNSWYNSLQFSLNKRLSRGLQFQSSFTWAKIIDETQGQGSSDGGFGDTSQQSDPTHREVDRGLATFDSDLNWKFNAIYRLPAFPFSSGVVTKVLNGWWMSGILSVQGGFPFTPALNTNRSRSGVAGGGGGIDRPDLVVGRNNDNIILGGPERYYDPGAFTIPAAGFLGTAGRNILRGPGEATLDFSLGKDTALGFLGESGRLEFRAEFFNLLNRVNFSQPDRIVFAARANVEAPLATAGQITSTSGTSRQIQLALKILF